ncbi:MAG TPA: hypothetical protein VGI36_15605, partial [Candidatus Binataceae bacterium]
MSDNTEAIALLPHCMTEALDQLLPGEVYVATGGSQNCAAWGEILTATARTRGAIGARQNRCAAKTV